MFSQVQSFVLSLLGVLHHMCFYRYNNSDSKSKYEDFIILNLL